MRKLGLVLGSMLIGGLPALADIYTLDQGNDALGDANRGSVTVTPNGANTVHIRVDLLANILFVNAGYDGSFDFNLIGNPTITFSNISSGWAAFGTNPQNAGSLKFDGFGDYEYGLDCTACGSGGSTPQPGPLQFDVTAAGLTIGSFKEKGGGGFYFGVDVIDKNAAFGTNGQTGAIGASGFREEQVVTPEPGAIFLLGTAAALCGLSLRKRFKTT